MSLNLRKASKNDINFIQKYENLFFNKTTSSGNLSQLLNNPLMKVFILEEKNSPIGYTIIWLDKDKSQIYSLGIKPENQGKGCTKELLDSLFRYYKINKIKEISLEVRISNIKAIKMYKSYGFKTINVRKNYYKDSEDALFLYRKL